MHRLLLIWVGSAVLGLLGVAATPASAKDECVECHKNPEFMVTNKKLYDYYQNWQASAHGGEEATCADCHKGNPRTKNKDEAHKNMLRGKGGELVDFQQIPKMCGGCHEKLYKSYVTSRHYKKLLDQKAEQQGPHCVTCHGSVSAKALDVTTVRATCEKCHTEEKNNHPATPRRAEELLNELNTIRAYTRFVTVRGDAADVQYAKKVLQPKIEALAVTWHTFDLKNIEPASHDLLNLAKQKRKEITVRKGKKAPSE